MLQECTFKPTISKEVCPMRGCPVLIGLFQSGSIFSLQSEAIVADRRNTAMAVHVRLYKDAEKIKKKQEVRQSRANVRAQIVYFAVSHRFTAGTGIQELENVTFKPEITSVGNRQRSVIPVVRLCVCCCSVG
jgi:hypothetical protein